MKIIEGLLQHDLDFTIMPLISIDEYRSKIDDRKAIVVGFYVTDSDPAADLAAFIEKGVVKVLDTEVSPAPTEDGHYLVFVEMYRNEKFPKKLLKILSEVQNITNVTSWEFSPFHSKEGDNYPVTISELRKRVNLDPTEVVINDSGDADNSTTPTEPAVQEQIATFLKNALVEGYSIDENIFMLKQFGSNYSYRVDQFDYDDPEIPVVIGSIGDTNVFESNKLQNMLGNNYSVYSTGTHLLVADATSYMLLRPLD